MTSRTGMIGANGTQSLLFGRKRFDVPSASVESFSVFWVVAFRLIFLRKRSQTADGNKRYFKRRQRVMVSMSSIQQRLTGLCRKKKK